MELDKCSNWGCFNSKSQEDYVIAMINSNNHWVILLGLVSPEKGKVVRNIMICLMRSKGFVS